MVADEAELEGDPGLFRVAQRRRVRGVGDGEDAVRLHRVLPGELAAELAPGLVHAAAPDAGVGPGEVDQLEEARRRSLRRQGPHLLHLAVPDPEHLARLDVPHVLGADDVQRAGLRGHDGGAVQPPEDERAEAPGVADGVEGLPDAEDQGEGAGDLGERVVYLGPLALAPGPGDEVDEGLRVAVRLEDGPFPGEPLPEHLVVGEVAVVGQGQGAPLVVHQHRLGVAEQRLPGGGVADVAQGRAPLELADVPLLEDVAHQPHAPVGAGLAVVADGDDPRRLLPPVLQGVEPHEGQLRGGLGAAHREDPALVAGLAVVRDRESVTHLGRVASRW